LSQASWGRLEMKPKRDEKQGDTKRDIKGTRQKEVTVQARCHCQLLPPVKNI
jgi:hypothetical protein